MPASPPIKASRRARESSDAASNAASHGASDDATTPGTRPAAPGRTRPSKQLDVFDNPHPERDYLIHMQVPEFTCLCPLTGQPDFAHFTIDYVPHRLCVELKSLKLYTWSFRDEGAFHEAVTNRVLGDLAAATRPRFMRVTARWGVRGGIFTNIVVEHRKRGWTPAAPVVLAAFAPESPTR